VFIHEQKSLSISPLRADCAKHGVPPSSASFAVSRYLDDMLDTCVRITAHPGISLGLIVQITACVLS
jgi:hypothetical protein